MLKHRSIKQKIEKSLWKESLKASRTIAFDENHSLTVKFSAKQIRDALPINEDGKVDRYEFNPEFYRHLSDLRIYDVVKAEKVEVELDSDCEPEYIEAFQITWKRYYGQRLWKHNQDIKEARKRNIKSLIGGIIAIVIFLTIQVLAVVIDNKGLTIAAICVEWLLILIWVFFSDLYQSIIYKYKPLKRALIDFYLLYEAKFINNKKEELKKVNEVKKEA